MPASLPLADAPTRGRRTWSQRILLTVSVLLTTVAVAGASLAGWGAWKLRSIDRADVALDELVAEGPANYLIVGSDTRAGGDPIDPNATDDRAPLADTIMLVRIDPGETTAKVLSLPRDLWVTQPTTGEEGRINAAYANGPQELIDTLRAELDVPINHYVEVDFQGFQEVVSSIDGVPVWFDRAMRDDNSGLNIEHPGCVVLDGPQSLAYARARHLRYFDEGAFTYDGTGDLGRISRQQAFLRRVIDRSKSKGLSNPLTLKSLVDAGTANTTIDDNLSVAELLALGKRFSAFDAEDLETYTLPNIPRTTSGGAQVVDLDVEAAEPVLDLFRPGAEQPVAPTVPGVSTSDPDRAGDEAVTPDDVALSVLNASGREGEALEVADTLVSLGFTVDEFGNGDLRGHPSESTTIVRYGSGADADALTVAAFVAGDVSMELDATMDRGDVALFLGEDFGGLNDPEAPGSTSTSTTTSSIADATSAETPPAPAEPVGIVAGDPPAGRTCG